MENSKLKILFLPVCYPSKQYPISGIFIKEHIKTVSFYNKVVVIFNEVYDRNIKKVGKFFRIKRKMGSEPLE